MDRWRVGWSVWVAGRWWLVYRLLYTSFVGSD